MKQQVPTQLVVFDFDGVLGRLFEQVGTTALSTSLKKQIADCTPSLEKEVSAMEDPFDIMKYVSRSPHVNAQCMSRISSAFQSYERHAALRCRPTEGALDVLRRLRELGVRSAIVSDNSAAAIEISLTRWRARHLLSGPISGRASGWMGLKPDPTRLIDTLEETRVRPESALVVGDNLVDIQMAQSAGVQGLAFSTRHSKRSALRASLPSTVPVLDSLGSILDHLDAPDT